MQDSFVHVTTNFLPCKEQSKMKYSRVVQLQVTSCYISDAGSKQNQALNN